MDPRQTQCLGTGSGSASRSDVPTPSGVYHKVVEQLPVCFGLFLFLSSFFFFSSSLYEPLQDWRLARDVGGLSVVFLGGMTGTSRRTSQCLVIRESRNGLGWKGS